MTYKSLSLAFTAKKYALNNTEDVEKYIFDNLNEQMVKAIDLLKNLDYDNLIVALVSLMTEAELEKLGEYLLEERLIHQYQNCYYFEVPEKIHYEGAIFDC